MTLSPHSYRQDSSVPTFTASAHICVMDAKCALCARGAAWIARNDKAEEFTIIPLQSPLGNALMIHYGMDPKDPTSWLYLDEGRAFTSLAAFIRVGQRLGGRWRAVAVLKVLPKLLQNSLYRLVARNRYKLFGTADMCALPDPAVQKRLLQ